jgi:miniconductance mechanosensitive channel
MNQLLHIFINNYKLPDNSGVFLLLAVALWLIGLGLVAALFYFLRRMTENFIRKTINTIDDLLIQYGVVSNFFWLFPVIYSYLYASTFLSDPPGFEQYPVKISLLVLCFLAFLLLNRLLSFADAVYMDNEHAKDRPIKSYVQMAKAFFWVVCAVFMVSIVTGTEPWGILSGVGAVSAVILFIFKDIILGLMASIQLTANHMVHLGDWIEAGKFGADGEVVEISLQSVKVRNWDMTYTMIPIYALVSDSFKNWRGMVESGGRRIQRSILLDVHSVSHVDGNFLERLSRDLDPFFHFELPPAGQVTNISLYRQFLTQLLARQPQVNQQMKMAVRLLAPGPYGLPVELYFFNREKSFPAYEDVFFTILEQALAALPLFGLRAFQLSSVSDPSLLPPNGGVNLPFYKP